MRPSAQPLWSTPAFVTGAILLYLVAHLIARLAMAPTLGIDDSEQALFAQHFAWGYRFRQPSLFTWMLLPAFEVFGVNIAAISVLRYLLLGLGYAFMYLTARRVIADPACAALSVFSFALIYVFAFYAHHDLTHTTALSTAIAATFYVFVRLAERPSLARYLLFGLVIGIGALTKFNFLMLAVGLPLTCLILQDYRHLVLTWKSLPAMALAGLVVLPSALWMLTHVASFGGLAADITGAKATQSWGGAMVEGSVELALAVLAFPQPLLPLFLAALALPMWRGRATVFQTAPSGAIGARFLGVLMLVIIVQHWLLVPTLGATAFAERWMHPALMILPVFLFALVAEGRPSRRAVAAYLGMIVLLVAVAFAARIVVYARGADHCGSCRALAPFAELTDQLRAAGFRRGTILADDFHVGGNLRVAFPDSRVILPTYPLAVWPEDGGGRQCLVVWRVGDPSADALPAAAGNFLAERLSADPDAPHSAGHVAANMLGSETRVMTLRYRLYDDGPGDCR